MSTAAEVFEQELRDLILRGLGENYMSVTCADGEKIQTGNHYQSVSLGDVRTRGFRDDRAKVLDQIDFTGKKVLDLGCNLGELSREARARGASLVDGFEYDPYFIEIGELVNALTGTTRVSFYERDIGDTGVYQEHYDMVLAFAVMGQGAAKAMGRIAEVTDVLVLETHRLEGNFEDGYMNQVSTYFPHHRMLGESDWGATFDRHEVRATLIFAKTEEALAGALQDDAVPVLEDPAEPTRQRRPANGACVMWTSSARCSRRSSSPPSTSRRPSELFTAVAGMDVDVAALARSHDSRVEGYDGWVLWFLYLKGYLEYAEGGEVGPGNSYFNYLTDYHAQVGDPTVEQTGRMGFDARVHHAAVPQHGPHARSRGQSGGGRGDPADPRDHERAHGGPAGDLRARRRAPGRDDAPRRLAQALLGKALRGPAAAARGGGGGGAEPVFGELESFEFDGERLSVSGWVHGRGQQARPDRGDSVGSGAVVGGTTTTLQGGHRPSLRPHAVRAPHRLQAREGPDGRGPRRRRPGRPVARSGWWRCRSGCRSARSTRST